MLDVRRDEYSRWRWEDRTGDDVVAHGQWHAPKDSTARGRRAAAVAAVIDMVAEKKRRERERPE